MEQIKQEIAELKRAIREAMQDDDMREATALYLELDEALERLYALQIKEKANV